MSFFVFFRQLTGRLLTRFLNRNATLPLCASEEKSQGIINYKQLALCIFTQNKSIILVVPYHPTQRLAAILSVNTTAKSFKTEEKLRACFKNPLILLLSRLFLREILLGFSRSTFTLWAHLHTKWRKKQHNSL